MFWFIYFAAWVLGTFYLLALRATLSGLRGRVHFDASSERSRWPVFVLSPLVMLSILSLVAAPFFLIPVLHSIGAVILSWIASGFVASFILFPLQNGWPFRQDHISYVFVPVAGVVAFLAILTCLGSWLALAIEMGWRGVS